MRMRHVQINQQRSSLENGRQIKTTFRIVKEQTPPEWRFENQHEHFEHHLDHTRLLGWLEAGGASRDRTGDLLLAKQALSQLSYGPCLAQ